MIDQSNQTLHVPLIAQELRQRLLDVLDAERNVIEELNEEELTTVLGAVITTNIPIGSPPRLPLVPANPPPANLPPLANPNPIPQPAKPPIAQLNHYGRHKKFYQKNVATMVYGLVGGVVAGKVRK